jgi:hypothetical protein
MLVAIAARIGGRMAGLYGVLATAAGADKEIAELYRGTQQARYRDQQRAAKVLGRSKALKRGLSVNRATDIIWALANPTNVSRSGRRTSLDSRRVPALACRHARIRAVGESLTLTESSVSAG